MIKTKRLGEWFEITLPSEWDGLSIDSILRDKWEAPKKHIHLMRMEKEVKINGEFIPWQKPLSTGDKIQIRLFQQTEFGVTPEFFDIEIVYEDDHIIVFNKPANMDTHPNSQNEVDTLANAAAYYLLTQGEFRKIKHVHRLDRDTTGAVLFAKHPLAGAILDRMLEERKIKRTYLALVHGVMKANKGTIREPIGRDRHHPTRRRVSPTGQSAITHYEVLETFPKEKFTLIQCQLATGRTHQIRVHLSFLGHPLVGDGLYGGQPIIKRQALHAAKLVIPHPFTEELISCHALSAQEPFLDKYFQDWPNRL